MLYVSTIERNNLRKRFEKMHFGNACRARFKKDLSKNTIEKDAIFNETLLLERENKVKTQSVKFNICFIQSIGLNLRSDVAQARMS